MFCCRWLWSLVAGRRTVNNDYRNLFIAGEERREARRAGMDWYVNEKLYGTQSFWWSSSKIDGNKGASPMKESDLHAWHAPFDQKFFLIMNVAVGGKFPGNPDKTTKFPVEMVVDYVRVYDKVGGYGETKPRGEGKLPFSK